MDVDNLLSKATESVTVGRAFGPPIERDGTLIIPVAWVAGGGGGGGAEGNEDQPNGAGVGFGGFTWPLGVYVVKNGKLEFDKVDTGIAGELMIELKKGPTVGQEIVTGPFKVLRQVKEGDRVLVDKGEGGDKKGSPKPA